jgi:chitin synthase
MDGRQRCAQDTLEYLAEAGCYENSVVEAALETGRDINMHLFEHLFEFHKEEFLRDTYPPIQLVLAMKEHNRGKLDSHLWFFMAFAEQLNPHYLTLLDCGTKPNPDGLVKCWDAFDQNARIGVRACDRVYRVCISTVHMC